MLLSWANWTLQLDRGSHSWRAPLGPESARLPRPPMNSMLAHSRQQLGQACLGALMEDQRIRMARIATPSTKVRKDIAAHHPQDPE
jgi:hypothetical protein